LDIVENYPHHDNFAFFQALFWVSGNVPDIEAIRFFMHSVALKSAALIPENKPIAVGIPISRKIASAVQELTDRLQKIRTKTPRDDLPHHVCLYPDVPPDRLKQVGVIIGEHRMEYNSIGRLDVGEFFLKPGGQNISLCWSIKVEERQQRSLKALHTKILGCIEPRNYFEQYRPYIEVLSLPPESKADLYFPCESTLLKIRNGMSWWDPAMIKVYDLAQKTISRCSYEESHGEPSWSEAPKLPPLKAVSSSVDKKVEIASDAKTPTSPPSKPFSGLLAYIPVPEELDQEIRAIRKASASNLVDPFGPAAALPHVSIFSGLQEKNLVESEAALRATLSDHKGPLTLTVDPRIRYWRNKPDYHVAYVDLFVLKILSEINLQLFIINKTGLCYKPYSAHVTVGYVAAGQELSTTELSQVYSWTPRAVEIRNGSEITRTILIGESPHAGLKSEPGENPYAGLKSELFQYARKHKIDLTRARFKKWYQQHRGELEENPSFDDALNAGIRLLNALNRRL
jgi:hypothetical protein